MKWFYIGMALVAGAFIPFQANVNAQLRIAVGDPVLAAIISFLVGTTALILYFFITGHAWPSLAVLSQPKSWWMWIGGVLGAYFVLTAIVATPQLGAANLVALMIAGQLFIAMVFDHFGAFGLPVRTVNPMRLLGVAVLFGGALLVTRY